MAWQWALGLILAAAVITTFGLVPISVQFTAPSRPWAVAGLVSFAMGATLSVIGRLVGIGVITWAAPQYPDPTALAIYEAFSRMRTGPAFVVLAFTAVTLYGAAMIRMRFENSRLRLVNSTTESNGILRPTPRSEFRQLPKVA